MPYVNVRDYGAFVNSDISQAYEAAVTDAESKGIHKIVLPPGPYNVLSEMKLREGLIIDGDAMLYRETGGTVLQCVGDINAFTTGLVDSDTEDMRSVRLSNFVVSGDKSLVAGTRTGYGLTGSHLRYNINLDNICFKYFKDGIHLSNSWVLDLYNVVSNYNDRYGLYLENGANRVNVRSGELNRNGVSGFCSPAGTTIKNQGISFWGTKFELNTSHGALVNGVETVKFDSAYFEGNGGYNLYLRGESGYEVETAIIDACHFFGTEASGYGINIGEFAHAVKIGTNNFNNMTGAGIRIVEGANQDIVIDPSKYDNCAYPIQLVGSGNAPKFTGKTPVVNQL